MGFRFTNLALLVWKNLVLFKRRPWVTAIELALPLFFSFTLTLQRILTDTTDYNNNTIFQPKPVSFMDRIPKTYLPNASFEFCYSPSSQATDDVMARFLKSLKDEYPWMKHYSVHGFGSKSELIDHYNAFKSRMPIAFHFHDVNSATARIPNNTKYAVMPATLDDDRWKTHSSFKRMLCHPTSDESYCDFDFPEYRDRGILTMLRVMDESIMGHWGAKPGVWSINTQRMPLPDFEQDPIVEGLVMTMPGSVMFSFVVTVIVLTKAIVHEKQIQLKESMKMMGLSSAMYWTSWFLTYFLWMLVMMALYVAVGMTEAIKHADVTILLVYMWVYGVCIVSFCFMISVFVQSANLGAIVAVVVYVCTFLPQYFLDFDDISQSSKMASSLLFNTGLAWGIKTLLYYDETGKGVEWDTIDKAPSVDHDYTLADSILMLLVDTAIHLLIAWYVDNVYPGDYGIPKPFYFPFTKSYWYPKHTPKYDGQNYVLRDPSYFEDDPSLKAGIRMTDLRKVYGGKVVVEGTTVNMYEGQISVLLGHNGAGKSTTIGMLTGLTQPTSGTALVNGYDIWTETESVRSSLGLCPQHNILFDTLTVTEHLYFFAVLKGMSRKDAKPEVEKYVEELGLKGKEQTQSKNLSGGQKRKLSVGVALIAGSKVVILDEPSSGLDPGARRQMWEMLQRNKHGRTVLLTTHYMEEADVLGDRILIMAKGAIQCAGSSMFLKKIYGEGYHLILVKGVNYDTEAVSKLIAKHVPNSYFQEEVGCEISYHLPNEDSKKFPALFRVLEERQKELGLDGFGTTATTMEEVFLKVGEVSDLKPKHRGSLGRSQSEPLGTILEESNADESDKKPLIKLENGHRNGSPFNKRPEFNNPTAYKTKSGQALALGRFKAMIHKKALYWWRSKIISLVQILIPVGFTIAALVIANNIPDIREEKEIPFDLSDFDDTVTIYSDGVHPSPLSTQLSDNYVRFIKRLGDGDLYRKVDRRQWPDIQRYFLDDRISDVGLSTFNQRYVTGVNFERSDIQVKSNNNNNSKANTYNNNNGSNSVDITGYFNTRPWHSEPISLVEVMNSIVSKVMGQGYSIRTSLDPMPKPGKDQADDILNHSGTVSSVVSMFTGIGMGFIVSSFVFSIIMERQVGSKHLQTVSGVSPLMYWGPTFLWDFVNFIIPAFIIVIVLIIADEGAFTDSDGLGTSIILFIMYGWACIPYSYLLQFAFNNATSGFTMIFMFNIFTCMFPVMAVFIVQVAANDRDIDEVVRTLVSIPFPSTCLCLSIMELYQNYNNKDFCESTHYSKACELGVMHPCCENTCEDSCLEFEDKTLSLDFPGAGRFVIFLFLQGSVCLILLALKEYNFFDKLIYRFSRDQNVVSESTPLLYNSMSRGSLSREEDSDVCKERVRIQHTSEEDMAEPGSLVIKDICKQYGDFLAVDHLHVGVERQQCFGLLGENGAGKTTTFNMLTGRTMLTSGNAYMGGWSVKDDLKMAQSNMGYCPQFDALANQLTGRETLTFYGRVKGIPDNCMEDIIKSLMDGLGFRPHIDKLVGNYSGGNKRKLSTAVALLGDPDFLFLDEPSSGMDPAARRHLWDVLGLLRESGKTLILTSHSMEECDALCTQIAIMVNGKFKCLGSPQHLKNKFGQGYILKAKLVEIDAAPVENNRGHQQNLYTNPGASSGGPAIPPTTMKVINFIEEKIPDAQVFDVHQGYLHMQVPEGSSMLSDIFKVMESAKKRNLVYDYFVHQTSLEQVFLSFARHQNVRTVPPSRGCCRRYCCCCC